MGAFEDYAAAKAEFERAHAAVDAIAADLANVSQLLKTNRGRFTFSNTGVGFPMDVLTPRSPSMNGDDWKSAKQINEALARWHSAKERLSGLWHAMPKDQKDALQPPPAAAMTR